MEQSIPPQPTIPTSTTESTITKTIVQPSQAPTYSPPPYGSWDSVVYVIGGLIAFCIGFQQILNLIKGIGEFFDKKKKKDVEQDAPIIERIKKLESNLENFWEDKDLRREFDALKIAVKHERDGRQANGEAAAHRFRVLEEMIQNDRLAFTRLESKVGILSDNSDRTASAVESLRERVDERFDQLRDVLINKKNL